MALPIGTLLAVVALLGLALYRFIVFPAFISPLRKIPNAHWSAAVSRLWILSNRLKQRDTLVVHAAHQRLGPIIRLGPSEISVNSVDGGIRSVYGGGFEKGDWYSNVFSNYGVMPMFAMPDHGMHSKRKRMISNVYAKTTLQTSQTLAASSKILLEERLMPRLRAMAAKGQPIEWYDIMSSVTMDFVNSYIFGLENGSDFIRKTDECTAFLKNYKGRQTFTFWPQEVPGFTNFMKSIGLRTLLVPQWVNKANQDIEAFVLSMCDRAEASLGKDDEKEKARDENYPTVYAQLRNAFLKESSKSDLDLPIEEIISRQRLAIASEVLDHSMAGFDTSGITLTYLTWELSRPQHKMWQEKLRAEVKALGPKPSPKEIDQAPILHAILTETLRMHAAIPGNQPRVTPADATLGAPGHSLGGLPPDVRVNAQAWSLHRNPDVYPEPEVWNPERWLSSSEAQLREMGRWFWAFGSGGRMCVGSNLAMQEMKAVMAHVWGPEGLETTVVDDTGMGHNGGYLAEPVGANGKFLILDVKDLKA